MMRKILGLLLAACLLGPLLPGARGEGADPEQTAKNLLTEVYGYTEEEAEAFTFDDPGDGLHFAPADHPEWEYYLPWDDAAGVWDVGGVTSPFQPKGWYSRYPGEGAARALLREVKERGWFARWTAADREALRAALISAYEQTEMEEPAASLNKAMEEALATDSDAARAVQALFEQLFGPVENWSEAVTGWRNELLDGFGLSLTADAPPERGIRAYNTSVYYRGDRTADFVRFLEEVPAELDGALAPFRAQGWEALSGGYLRFDTPTNDSDPEDRISGMGLVFLGQEARRLTCILDRRAEAWELWPMGENCLLDGELPAVDFASHVTTFRLTWALSPEKELRMTVLPSVAARKEEGYVEAVCHIEDCTVVDLSGGGALYPALPHHYLGAADMSRLSLTVTDDETQAQPSLIPEGYVMAGGVHLRADHSSHSEDLGLLNRGVLLPVLDVTDGTEYPWIRTQLGPLKGYVSANYTSYQEWGISDPADVAPIPVAEARQPLSLYGDKGFLGTGLLAPAVAELSAGARMHVLIFSGDWLFVAAPRAELGWFMDPDSDFGWVRASEVRLASMAAQLDWLE